MAAAAGVNEPVALNTQFHPGRLQVYTTTPTSREVTHCDLGNAVYDAELDAIFLDRNLFDNRNFQTFLSSTAYGNVVSLNDLPFVQTYVRFLMLHELGHRALHRKRGGVFDRGGVRSEIQEREADAFALRHLQAAYAMPQAVSGRVGAGGADLLDLPYQELSPADRTLADLAGMVAGMNLSLLFISNPYAPFYRDSAHETFLTRSRGLLQEARQQKTANVQLSASLDAIDELLSREESALSNPLAEIMTSDPIADVIFDQNGLLITSVEFTKLFHVGSQDLERALAKAESANHFRSIWAGVGGTSDGKVDDWWKVGLWSIPTGETFAWRSDGLIWKSGEHGWDPIKNFPWDLVKEQTGGHLYIPPQPSAVALLESDDHGGHPWLSSLARDRVVISRSEADIADEIQRYGGPIGCLFTVIAVTDQSTFLSVNAADGKPWGVSEIDLSTLRVKSDTKLRFPTIADESLGTLAVSPSPSLRFLTISSTGEKGVEGAFVVWELSATEPPAEVVRFPYFHSRSAYLQHVFGGQSIASIDWTPGGKILLGIGNDSLYSVDLTSRRMTPIFHPGDEIVKKRVGRNGMIAVFVQGGYKCYVINLR
jgi:hypothetical protein